MDFYYNSICHMCKQVRPDLKKCASCRFISYCSKEHQISDWKNHKQVCKILSKSKKILTLEENCGYDRWRSYRTDLQFYLMLRLNREILPHESQMWMFPRNCAVCYSVEGLKDCQECFCLCYCSKEHQTLDRETHQRYCSELKLCLDLDRFYLSNPEVDVELKEIDMKVEQLPISIHECIELFLNTSKLNGPLQRIFVTDILQVC
ncbi:hypothetical protein HHI36_004276 [Cryptolaemus montrouzieri]|uniref:MYND-type domain-containing protein n=1 Tax=Cryptolaemus montrouzieri TaxID=559131 RepID=A0ABD2NRJ0_9CUCU